MNRSRWLLLIVGPVPILFGSMVLTRWAKPGSKPPLASNDVLLGSLVAAPIGFPDRDPGLEKQCDEVGQRVEQRLGPGFQVVIRAPFVLAGDLSEQQLKAWHHDTIGPAARALASAYFDRDPHQPITVLLFSNEQTYYAQAQRLFGDEHVSVYGYYKPRHRTLVMNISTGGGTLVHELTHALVDFDFPEVPEWFNEGLASLHEQCRFRPDGSGLDGLVNWRLPILQQALEQDRLAPLDELIQADEFRGPDEAVHYAQARYVCLYLQEKGLLEDYFRRFRAARRSDPRGLRTLQSVLGDRPWDEIDAEFRAWVGTKSLPSAADG